MSCVRLIGGRTGGLTGSLTRRRCSSTEPVIGGAASTGPPRLATVRMQTAIITDASKSVQHENEAKRLRREAEAQLELLTATNSPNSQSDFYTYRYIYMAGEGFLPGYNFPRLPLSAHIPGRRARRGSRDEFVQRPRFLAITEFRSAFDHLPRGRTLHRQQGDPANPATGGRGRRADRARDAVRGVQLSSQPVMRSSAGSSAIVKLKPLRPTVRCSVRRTWLVSPA